MHSLADRTQSVILETERLRFATGAKTTGASFGSSPPIPSSCDISGQANRGPTNASRNLWPANVKTGRNIAYAYGSCCPKDSDTLIGICGLQHLPEGPDVEIGWWLAPSHWGQGLATEAARQALAYGFQVIKLQRIVAIAQAANRDSLRVMDRIGMRFEREAVHKGLRVVLYVIDRDMFSAQQPNRENGA